MASSERNMHYRNTENLTTLTNTDFCVSRDTSVLGAHEQGLA